MYMYAHFARVYECTHVCMCTTQMPVFLEAEVGVRLPVAGVTNGFECDVDANCWATSLALSCLGS